MHERTLTSGPSGPPCAPPPNLFVPIARLRRPLSSSRRSDSLSTATNTPAVEHEHELTHLHRLLALVPPWVYFRPRSKLEVALTVSLYAIV